MTIWVICDCTSDEAGENDMDNGTTVGIWARLEANVADVILTDEIELLSKKVSRFVGRLRDVEREAEVSEAGRGSIGDVPVYADQCERRRGKERREWQRIS